MSTLGSWPQKRAQHRRERESDLFADLHLIDAVEIDFDRILGGGNVAVNLVERGQRRVEGRGLAATRRAGHQDHPRRLGDRLPEEA